MNITRPEFNIVKSPTALMNDYTKNISSSIFTPGVHYSGKILKSHFMKSREGTGSFDNSSDPQFHTSTKGL